LHAIQSHHLSTSRHSSHISASSSNQCVYAVINLCHLISPANDYVVTCLQTHVGPAIYYHPRVPGIDTADYVSGKLAHQTLAGDDVIYDIPKNTMLRSNQLVSTKNVHDFVTST